MLQSLRPAQQRSSRFDGLVKDANLSTANLKNSFVGNFREDIVQNEGVLEKKVRWLKIAHGGYVAALTGTVAAIIWVR